MKIFKPYLSLSKTTENYILDAVLAVPENYTIEKIEQQEVDVSGTPYWGVIITSSTKTQLVNSPAPAVLSTVVSIDLDKSQTYSKIKCIVQQVITEGELGPSQDEETDIGFDDGE